MHLRQAGLLGGRGASCGHSRPSCALPLLPPPPPLLLLLLLLLLPPLLLLVPLRRPPPPPPPPPLLPLPLLLPLVPLPSGCCTESQKAHI